MRTAEAFNVVGLMKTLSDPIRLRILGLLDREELTVGELAESLGLTQSRVSNHLRLLREADLLNERHAGPSTHLRLAKDGPNPSGTRIWEIISAELPSLPEYSADLVRLDSVLSRRQGETDFFDRLAGHWDKVSGDFRTGQARHRAAVHMMPSEFVVADLGCGTGYMSSALTGMCARVIAIDQSPAMLEEAKGRLTRLHPHTSIEFRQGELDALPLEGHEVDGVVAGMVLHHLESLEKPLSEMRRALKPGGTAVVLDMAPHREAWMRQALGDRHLGLEPSDVVESFKRAGFVDVVLDPVDDHYQPRHPEGRECSLSLFVVRGRTPRR